MCHKTHLYLSCVIIYSIILNSGQFMILDAVVFIACVSPCVYQALLLVANSVDSNADCTRLVVDRWLELELREPEEALKVLSTALTLRAEWERLLLAQLEQSPMEEPAVQGVSRRVMEKLSESLVRFLLYTEVLKLR